MMQEQRLADEKLQKQRDEWEAQVRAMNERMRAKEDEIKAQMQTEGDLDKRRLAEQLAQQEAKLAEELVRAEIVFEKKQHELMAKQRELESSLQQQMREAKQLSLQKDRERIERIRFDDELLHSIPLINEANSIGDELQRETVFALKLVTCWPPLAALSTETQSLEDDEAAIAAAIAADLKVLVNFQETGTFRSVLWDTDVFHASVYVMREMYQVFIENNRVLSSVAAWRDAQESDVDPFYEPPQPQLIGKSYVYLHSLAFGCKVSESVPILDHRGVTTGTLKCDVTPTVLSHEWQALQHRLIETCSDDLALLTLPTLSDFVGSNVRVNVCVDRLRGIPGKLCKDVYVVVKWTGGESDVEEHTSPPTASPTVDPEIDFSVVIERSITPALVAAVSSTPLELSVFGIVPSSNLNSVASQVIDLQRQQSDASQDDADDSGDSVAFFDVDAHGKNRIASAKKSVRRRNGKLLSDADDAATLLGKCQEQLAVQSKILAENTQELEHKTHEVLALQHQLHEEQAERDKLRDAIENLARTNKLLQAKLEQQILKQSVAKLTSEQQQRKRTAAAVEMASSLGAMAQVPEHEPEAIMRHSGAVRAPAPLPSEDINALVHRAVFDEMLGDAASSSPSLRHQDGAAQAASARSRDAVHRHTASHRSKGRSGGHHEHSAQSPRSKAYAVVETPGGGVRSDPIRTPDAQPVETPPSGDSSAMATTAIVETTPSLRVRQKGLFHAVFSVQQHKGHRRAGCPVS